MLAQIKKNLLFTLTDREFALPDDRAEALLEQLTPDGGFNGYPYAVADPNGWSWRLHAENLSLLASNKKVMACDETKQKVLTGLRFFLKEHRENPNWWHNQIGLPRYAGRLYLCLEQALTNEEKQILLSYVEQGSIACHPNFLRWTGANLLWGVMNTVMHAVIANDADLMTSALEAAAGELKIQQPGQEGIQPDFSFLQHQTQFYTGGYGRSFLENMADLVFALQGTAYQFPADGLGVLAQFIIYGMRYCVRNTHLDYLTVGRELARPDALSGADSIRKVLLLLLKVEEMPCKDVMQEQLASMGAEGYALHGDKFFHEVNFYVSRTVTSHISCRGTSPLRSMGESINGENHLSANEYAGGATCIMVDGKEYENIFPLWDYAHIPGTTAPVETDAQIEAKMKHWHGTVGKNRYCGGVSHNHYGILYQDLNFDGITGVTARFFIDGVMIALGAGLTYDDEKAVTTTLNQCWQYDTVLTDKNGLPEGSVYQGRVAYVSLDGQAIQTHSAYKESGWSRINRLNPDTSAGQVCTFYIDHGIRPADASYAYAVIPAVSPTGAADRIREVCDKLTVLQNNKGVQAIRYGGQLFCVFHQNGTLPVAQYDHFTSSAPAAHILNLKK